MRVRIACALVLALLGFAPAGAQQGRVPRIGYLRPNEVPASIR